MKSKFLLLAATLAATQLGAQVYMQRGAMLSLQDHARVFVTGDLVMRSPVDGGGELILSGRSIQSIDAQGAAIDHLRIDNAADAVLISPLAVGELALDQGHLRCGASDLIVAGNASGSSESYIVTDGGGTVRAGVTGEAETKLLPIGTSDRYMPLLLQGSSSHSPTLEISAEDGSSPHAPVNNGRANGYWRIRSARGSETGTLRVASATTVGSALSWWNGTAWATLPNTPALSAVTITANTQHALSVVHADRALLFPNPAHDQARMMFFSSKDQLITWTLYNAAGVRVAAGQEKVGAGLQQSNLDLTGKSSGSYTVEYLLNGTRITMPLVKQ